MVANSATHDLAPRGASQEAIEFHYDVGSEFYALWLDSTLTYSAALWSGEDQSLEQAQAAKLDYYAQELRVRGANRVLDIGCGWGGMAKRLVTHHGVKSVTGLTISTAQADYARRLHSNIIDVLIEPWAQHAPREPYDGIVSIGAFEHFAAPDQSREDKISVYRDFFATCHRWMNPGTRLCLQTICYENATGSDLPKFFREEVFPQSDLPRLSEVVTAADGLFTIKRVRNDGEHYERTLRAWLATLRGHRATAEAMVGAHTVERYLKYLALSAVSFHTGRTGLLRLTMERIDNPRTAAMPNS